MKKLILAAVFIAICCTTGLSQSMLAPEKYSEFLEQICKMEQRKAEIVMGATMESLSKNPKGYRQMLELAEKRLSDPTDSIHNEGLYMAVLKHATENYVLSSAEKERQRLLLEGAKKNMVGVVAADFDFVTPTQKTPQRLKELKADNILIFFNDPDCEACDKLKKRLADDPFISDLVIKKKLIVLAIYPYENQKLWRKTKYPPLMINGFNQSQQIVFNELYDLPTLPCFYLLDKDYTVLMKNEGSLNKVESMLKQLDAAREVGPTPATAPASNTHTAAKLGDTAKMGDKNTQAQAKKSEPFMQRMAAPDNDPNTAMSKRVLEMMLNNQSNDIYGLLADEVKAQLQPEALDGTISKIEEQTGKYQGNEPWQIQPIHGQKAYTSVMNFEKQRGVAVIMYNDEGKITGLSIMPAQALGL